MHSDNRSGGNPIKDIWDLLGRSIYVGKRLEANMLALTLASFFTAALGLALIIVNLVTRQNGLMPGAIATLVAAVACAFSVIILKRRDIAILFPTAFCAVAFTVYAVTGAGEGSAMMWSLLLPIGMCYFVSVRYGIVLSIYHSVLFMALFYTPLRDRFSVYYTEAFMYRFPLLFISISIFTIVAMIQYHRNALFEIDYAKRLNDEVARQIAVAEERSRKIEQMSLQTILTLAHAIDAKDPYTRGHSTRVSQCSVLIAEALGWSKERVNDLRYAALLHDIGNIGVPDSILNKPTRLTDVEYGIIKSHTTMGGDILKGRVAIGVAEDIARYHHERYDGAGYPDGLVGEAIPEEARIVAIADAFDAMRSNRIYRKACEAAYIRGELTGGKGTQFDPRCVDILIDLWDRGLLDSEIDDELVEDDGDMESSSALLQEVMETFVAQSAADDIDLTTGVMGRTAGETAIAKAMQEEGACFALFDMDNLKKINDTNGHAAGDRALRLTGQTLLDNCENSLCCRLGGDEFILLMKDISREEAENRIRKIIDSFNEKKSSDAEIVAASLSAGAAMSTPAETYTVVFNRADKALYHVKQNGKSGYSFYNIESESDESVDAEKLVRGIHNSGSYQGALDVEYRQFARLYEYITNLEHRFSHPFKLLLIEIEAPEGKTAESDDMEKAMYYMDRAIRQTIRNVDVVTRYSRRQYLIILVGTDIEGVKIVIDRVFKGYYKMSGSGAYSPRYMVISP